MRLLVDLNLSPRWAEVLRSAGFEATHWSEIGRLDAPDAEIMAYAATHSFVVVTQDLDFGSILAATQGGAPSVIQVRADDVRPETIGIQIISAIRQMASALDQGALVAIEPGRTRVRILPLRR